MRKASRALSLALLLTAASCRTAPCPPPAAAPTAQDNYDSRAAVFEPPPPVVEAREHDVATVPYETVAGWPAGNAVAAHFVTQLLEGSGIPTLSTGSRGWEELSVPAALAPRCRRLLGGAIEAGQPGRRPREPIPTDAPPHLAFKVIE